MHMYGRHIQRASSVHLAVLRRTYKQSFMHDIYHLSCLKHSMQFCDIRRWVKRVPFTMSTADEVVQDGPCGGISAPEAVADDPPVAIEAITLSSNP